MKKYVFLLLFSPLVTMAQEKTVAVLSTDVYSEYPLHGIPVINATRTSIKMTCTGVQVPGAESRQVRFNITSPKDSTSHPLILLNGHELNFSLLKFINPSMIEKIDVIKSGSVMEKYGEKARHGIIVIQMKSAQATDPKAPIN